MVKSGRFWRIQCKKYYLNYLTKQERKFRVLVYPGNLNNHSILMLPPHENWFNQHINICTIFGKIIGISHVVVPRDAQVLTLRTCEHHPIWQRDSEDAV